AVVRNNNAEGNSPMQMERCKHGMVLLACALCRDTREGRRRAIAELEKGVVNSAGVAARISGGQPFPTIGTLFENRDLPLGALRARLSRELGRTYCYVETSMEL